MSMSKVVKVGEIENEALGLNLSALAPGLDRTKTDRTGSTMLAYGTDSSLLPTRGKYFWSLPKLAHAIYREFFSAEKKKMKISLEKKSIFLIFLLKTLIVGTH